MRYIHTYSAYEWQQIQLFHPAPGGDDYSPLNMDLAFSSAVRSHEVVIDIVDDESLEAKAESFTIELTNNNDDILLLLPPQSAITIIDNDST